MESWWKTQSRRVKEEFLQAIGAHERPTDEAFEKRIANFLQHAKLVQTVQENVLAYQESFERLLAASATVSRGLEALSLRDGGAFDGAAQAAAKAEAQVLRITAPAVRRVVEEAVLGPLGTHMATFPAITERIAQRRELLLDCASYKSRLAYEQSRGAPHAATAERAGKRVEDACERLQQLEVALTADLDRLEAERPTMLTTELSALVSCQTFFFGSAAEVLTDALPSMPEAAESLCRLEAYAYQQELAMDSAKQPAPGAGDRAAALVIPQAPDPTGMPPRGRAHPALIRRRMAPPPRRPSRRPSVADRAPPTAPLIGLAPVTIGGRIGAALSPRSARRRSGGLRSRSEGRPIMRASESAASLTSKLEGLVRSRVEARPHTVSAPSSPRECKALYDFESADAGDLSFRAGDRIVVLDDDPSGWWRGSVGGRQGIFPANRVERLP